MPTVAETPGLKGYDATIMYAVWAPAKTPPQIVATLNAAILKVLQTPQFRERLEFEGASQPVGGSPEHMAETIQSDMKKLTKLVEVSGLKPQ